MAPSGEAYNVDWVWSNNSDVHVANHLDWFTTYHPFKTEIQPGFDAPPGIILGIGDVALPTKTHPRRTGRDAHSVLKLKEVLYMPGATCNILGDLSRDGLDLVLDFGSRAGKLTDVATGATVGIMDLVKLFKLRLSGQSPSKSSLDKNVAHIIRANWSDGERQRWEAHKRQLPDVAKDQNSASKSSHSQVPPYTAGEKEWLKKNSKDEFHFLRMYGYSIYDEEERAEGRLLVRELMKEDGEEDEGIKMTVKRIDPEDGDDEDSEEESSFLRELEEVPESHFADHHFSKEELEFIKKEYGYSSNFLMSYRLKFYDDDDCREGKQILKQLMSDD